MDEPKDDNEKTTPRVKRWVWGPVLLSLCLVVGIVIGEQFAGGKSFFGVSEPSAADRVGQIIRYIESEYVDSLDANQLEEQTIKSLMNGLDPHSHFIEASVWANQNDPLEGSFVGIGIEYIMQGDTVVVLRVVEGGPSERAGLQPGDRLVTADDSLMAFEGLTNDMIGDFLRGPEGEIVHLGVKRKGNVELLEVEVTRGQIPINSIEVAYMLTEQTGYLKLTRFSKNTYAEFMEATIKLRVQGMQNLVIDLRENGGGIMNQAEEIAKELLSIGQMIVYTEGKSRRRDTTWVDRMGSLETMPVTLLINENSASASEILAGALQDNDRGLIVGRRSFGKGFVQEQMVLDDGSALRLTVARYYTPTGRCIQKPFGDGIDYYADFEERLASGELMHLDSVSLPDSLKFITPKGKVVYGGGGILPDLFVPLDTAGNSTYFSQLSYYGAFNQFAFHYVDRQRERFNAYTSYEDFDSTFVVDAVLMDEFVDYGESMDIPYLEADMQQSKERIEEFMKAYIARTVWSDEGYYKTVHPNDPVIKAALGRQ